MKLIKLITVLALAAAGIASTPADYVTRLRMFNGTPYKTLNCATYIETAKRARHCGARGMWDGCDGQMAVIAEFTSKNQIVTADLQAGDVLDFHAAHVVAFVGDGFMDSEPPAQRRRPHRSLFAVHQRSLVRRSRPHPEMEIGLSSPDRSAPWAWEPFQAHILLLAGRECRKFGTRRRCVFC
jgi:hypothetical protein